MHREQASRFWDSLHNAANFAFATVVSIEDISKGSTLTNANIWVKRPGTGEIPAADFESLLGKVATRDIPSDSHLRPTDFE